METQGFFASPRFVRWLHRGGKRSESSSASLRKAIEREFLYRGVSALAIKELTLAADHKGAYVEFYARPLYQHDERLKYKPWAQLFAEQVLEDAARVLRTTWTHLPSLDIITLKVLRRPLSTPGATDDPILLVRATGEATKESVLRWSKTSAVALLQQCEMRYELDPRLGLRALQEE
ncbi:MAG TPA: hypothetical protein VGX03_13540 [Candidatus Binatia bacterium]|jgi:hypothetical protein|nr:hypothetical protein [Candidatus Binatia bacterium]